MNSRIGIEQIKILRKIIESLTFIKFFKATRETEPLRKSNF